MAGRRPRAGAALALVLSVVAVSACGGPAADLFEVIRSGSIPGADVTLVPSGDGTVRCGSRGRRYELPDELLLTAENFDFSYKAKHHTALPSGANPVYTYVVRTPDGTFSFSDDTPHLAAQLRSLAAWTFTVARRFCR